MRCASIDVTDSDTRYEFATNEVVNAVACVTLETVSTETGSKEFIAVGTTVNRGEDLAAKGAVSLFLPSSVLYAYIALTDIHL